MRKRIRILILAVVVAAVIVPLGFALSLDQSSRAASAMHAVAPVSQVVATGAPIVISTSAAVTALPEVPEGAKLLFIGTALFGLAAVMRRTT